MDRDSGRGKDAFHVVGNGVELEGAIELPRHENVDAFAARMEPLCEALNLGHVLVIVNAARCTPRELCGVFMLDAFREGTLRALVIGADERIAHFLRRMVQGEVISSLLLNEGLEAAKKEGKPFPTQEKFHCVLRSFLRPTSPPTPSVGRRVLVFRWQEAEADYRAIAANLGLEKEGTEFHECLMQSAHWLPAALVFLGHGVHLVLFVFEQGRVLQSAMDAYNVLRALVGNAAPVVAVVTGCENDEPLQRWVTVGGHNCDYFQKRGMHFASVVCTTIVVGGPFESMLAPLRQESGRTLLQLLEAHSLKAPLFPHVVESACRVFDVLVAITRRPPLSVQLELEEKSQGWCTIC